MIVLLNTVLPGLFSFFFFIFFFTFSFLFDSMQSFSLLALAEKCTLGLISLCSLHFAVHYSDQKPNKLCYVNLYNIINFCVIKWIDYPESFSALFALIGMNYFAFLLWLCMASCKALPFNFSILTYLWNRSAFNSSACKRKKISISNVSLVVAVIHMPCKCCS